jgi:hypothetical protein
VKTRAVLVPFLVGALGLGLGLFQLAVDPERALFAYAAGFDVALTIALGALLFVMIAHTARARWFVVLERLASAVATTLPLFPVLFLPIALGVRRLYPWAGSLGELDPEGLAWAAHAHAWLNVPFFLGRSYFYLLTWSALAILLRGGSIRNDARPSEARVRLQRLTSAAGLPVMAFTLTFASFDWVMSMSTRWASDLLGLYVFAGSFAGAMGVTAFSAWLAVRARILPPEVRADHFHALGRVLLVSVIFWAYIAFCQFLLVWIADLPRESRFYIDRSDGAWAWASAALFFLHFAVPFLLLLSRPLKRSPASLAFVGAWVVCAHALDVYWLVLPPLHAGVAWLDLAFLVGVTGVCASFGAWRFFAALPVPIHDPALAASLRYQSP